MRTFSVFYRDKLLLRSEDIFESRDSLLGVTQFGNFRRIVEDLLNLIKADDCTVRSGFYVAKCHL